MDRVVGECGEHIDDGANHKKAKLPFVSYVLADGNLVTGQNPGSAKETATKVASLLR